MYPKNFITATLFAAFASAQTPPGFSPSCTTGLDLSFSNGTSVVPGSLLPVNSVQTQPALFASANLPNTTYVLIMIDPDVRFNGSEVTILHWLAQDLILAPGNALHPYTLVSANASNMIAPYIGPAPPAELPPRAHKYVQLLYAQPENFNIPSSYSKVMLSRVGFALDGFVKEAGLKELVAGSWFEVRNDSLVAGGNGTAGPVQTGDAVGGNVARDGILGTGLLVAMMCFLGL